MLDVRNRFFIEAKKTLGKKEDRQNNSSRYEDKRKDGNASSSSAKSSVEAETVISIITEEDLLKGTVSSFTHERCLQCLDTIIDVTSCRSLDKGWAIGWRCTVCGCLKQSKEMVTTFLMGALTNSLDPAQIGQYVVHRFPWAEQQEHCVHHLYMQIACVLQKDGCDLKKAFGDVDFFGHFTIFDILARSWFALKPCTFKAFRLQGVIMLCPALRQYEDKARRIQEKEHMRATMPAHSKKDHRELEHLTVTRSELITSSGFTTTLSTFIRCAVTEDGELISHKTLRNPIRGNPQDINVICRAMESTLTGGMMICESYNGESEVFTNEQALVRADPLMLQRCWDMLDEILAFVKESMTTDGEYCAITLSPAPSTAWTRGSLIVESKGAIDPSSLREDFKEAFGLSFTDKS